MFGKKKDAPKQKPCPCGKNILQAQWDTCPYCVDNMGTMPGSGGGARPVAMAPSGAAPVVAGGATAMVNIADLKMPMGGGEKQRGGPTVGWIVALSGDHKGEDFRLKAGKNVIGSASDCDIVLTDKKISRKHCTIRYEGGEFQVADLDSSNGTYVNEEKTQKHDLIDNDIIKLGDIQFKFKSVN
jgi:hypothetical protein